MTLRIDCHRHFGGSISPDFVWSAIQRTAASHLAESLADVQAAMTFAPGEPYGFHRFLDKFRILDEIHWSEGLLDDSIKQVSTDLIAADVDYCWLRFSINKYLHYINWSRPEAVRFIHDSFQKYAAGRIGLILSLKYESQRANQRQLARIIDHPWVQDMVVGIDLVGDEAYFDAEFYGPLLKPWHDAGKVVMAHVGESQPLANVLRSVSDMYVTDICHGLAVAPQPLAELTDQQRGYYSDLLARLYSRQVCFHMAITSTYRTGVWQRQDYYPIVDIIRSGNRATIGTDDPIQCGAPGQPLTLECEYDKLAGFGLTSAEINDIRRTAERRTARWRPVRPAQLRHS